MNYCPMCGAKLVPLNSDGRGWEAEGNCPECGVHIKYTAGDWGSASTYRIKNINIEI